MAEEVDATPIGGDWMSALDPASGVPYYHNTATGETTWEYPAELVEQQEAAAPSATAVWGDWMAAVDPNSGVTYYCNQATGVTQWEMPEGFAENAVAPADQATQGGETAEVQATQGGETTEVQATQEDTAANSDVPQAEPQQTDETRIEDQQQANSGEDASSAQQNDRFDKLRQFAEIGAKRKEESEARRQAATAARAELENKIKAAETAERATTIMSMAEAPPPEPANVEHKDMDEYVEAYFNLNRKGLFGKRTTVAKILSWKNDIIRTALRKMPTKELETQATQCFRNVTGFMGDRSSNKEEGGHAEKLLKICLHAPEELRDEVYCQIIKQTNNNPSVDSLIRGWQLMAICTGAFPPSSALEPYLTSFCNDHREDPEGVGAYAMYCMGRIGKAGKLGPRKEVPTAMEIDACKHRLPVLVRVYHLDGSFKMMPVTSWTTAADLNNMMAHELGIEHPEGFAVYEMTPESEERFVEQNERIMDLVAYWQRLFEEEKQEKEKLNVAKLYRLVYKVHMYFEVPTSDVYAHEELYRQAVYDVISGRYPCNDKDITELGALQIQVEFGDKGISLNDDTIWRFVPEREADADEARKKQLVDKIEKVRFACQGKSKREAQAAYIKRVKSWKIYGSSFFYVEPQMSIELPDEVFLAVNPSGVLLINPDTKDIIKEFPYAQLPTWGHSGSSFVLHVGDLAKQEKLYFQTEQGKEINDLVRAYVNHICA